MPVATGNRSPTCWRPRVTVHTGGHLGIPWVIHVLELTFYAVGQPHVQSITLACRCLFVLAIINGEVRHADDHPHSQAPNLYCLRGRASLLGGFYECCDDSWSYNSDAKDYLTTHSSSCVCPENSIINLSKQSSRRWNLLVGSRMLLAMVLALCRLNL